jgi:hypothetical protein
MPESHHRDRAGKIGSRALIPIATVGAITSNGVRRSVEGKNLGVLEGKYTHRMGQGLEHSLPLLIASTLVAVLSISTTTDRV